MSEPTVDYSDIQEYLRVANAVATDLALLKVIDNGIEACVAALRSGCKLLFCGNGGSAADAQHIATELTIRYIKDRPALAAIALTTDSSALTAAGNDLGFEQVFARQVEALGRPGDVLVGISTSGRSRNVIAAVEAALSCGMKTVFFGGGTGGALASLCDVSIVVPSATTARIQEMHILIGHIFCGQIERRLGFAEQ